MLLPSAAHPLRLQETFHGGCSSKPLLCISCHNCMQNKKALVGHQTQNMQLHATRKMVKQAQQEGNWGGTWPIKTTIRSSSMRRVSVFSPSTLPLVKQHHLVVKFREQAQCRVLKSPIIPLKGWSDLSNKHKNICNYKKMCQNKNKS